MAQEKQNGLIGINILSIWFVPHTNSNEDITATQRVNDFYFGWVMDPLVFGDYPHTVKKNAGSRIPSFTQDESKLVKGSFDFFGVNHYVSIRVQDNSKKFKFHERDVNGDMAANLIANSYGAADKFPNMQMGLQGVLEYFKQVYGNPLMYIHENGIGSLSNASLNDTARVRYFEEHIGCLLDAVRNGSNTKGYFTWSFLDLFELLEGFESHYGLYFVDFNDPELSRHPKLSATWYSKFLKGRKRSIGKKYDI